LCARDASNTAAARELPPAAEARIEEVRADLELAVIEARKSPPPEIPPSGDLVFLLDQAPIQPLILEALRRIVTIVSDLTFTAAERRQIVTAIQDEWLTQYPRVSRSSFLAAKQAQAWWVTLLQQQREAERTDIPSFPQQLQAYMDEVGWFDDDLADAAHVNVRSVERHRLGLKRPSRRSLASYVKAFTEKRGRPSPFELPPLPRRTRRRAPLRQRGPKKS